MMHFKNLFATLSLVFVITTQSTYCNNRDSFDTHAYMRFGVPDLQNKYKRESIPEKILNNIEVRVTPSDEWRWNNNYQSDGSGWQDCKRFWCDVGRGCKFLGKGIGKGAFFVVKSVGKGVHFTLEGVCDSVEYIVDTLDDIFEDEEPSVPHNPASPSPQEQANLQQRTNMQTIMYEQLPDLELYQQEFSDYLNEIDTSRYQDVYNRGAKRLEAYKEYKNNQQLYQEQYTISHEVTPFMERHSLDVSSFEVCNGNIIQQQLHMEVIEILTYSSEIERIFAEYNQSPLFSDLVAEGADLARECNTQGDVKTGFKIADYLGWLNEAEYPRLAHVIKQTAGVVVGTVEGGVNIVKNTYNIIRHPLDTGKGLACILGQAGTFLFYGVQELGPLALHLSFHGTPECYDIHPHFAQDINGIKNFYNQIVHELEQLPPEEQTRKVTAFCIELYFTGKFMGQVGKLKSAALTNVIKPGATSLANKLQLYKYKALTQTYTKIASTIASTQDIIKTTCKKWLKPPAYSYEAALDEAGNWRWVYDINPSLLENITTECTNLVPKGDMQGVLKRISMTEIIQSIIQENAIELLPGITEKSVATMIEYAAERDELQAISRKLIESGPMEGKYLKIKIDHLFTIDPKSTNQVKGLHHDFLGYLESTNTIKMENIRFGRFGEYMADVLWNGKTTRDKTFFPKHWSREKVLKKVAEAYDNFIASKVEVITDLDGKYHIDSYTNEGLKIHLIIDTKCNVKTAYPII